jgi:hypothetical protein
MAEERGDSKASEEEHEEVVGKRGWPWAGEEAARTRRRDGDWAPKSTLLYKHVSHVSPARPQR